LPFGDHAAKLEIASRRHPRLVRYVARLRRHRVAVTIVACLGILGTLALDLLIRRYPMAGFYLLPLTLLALAMHERVVALAAAGCMTLAIAVTVSQHSVNMDHAIILFYGVLAGGGLIVLSYLVERLTGISGFATVRAQLAEASADIVSMGSAPSDLDEMLQYAVERVGEQIESPAGLLLQLHDERWMGRAGYGLGVDAREIGCPFEEAPTAVEALRREGAVVVDDAMGAAGWPLSAVEDLAVERLLAVPLRASGKDVGVVLYHRNREAGAFTGEQKRFVENTVSYVAAVIENVRLMVELTERRRELELVRDASLDLAESIDTDSVLRAVVMRLVNALEMDACDIYATDLDQDRLSVLVSYDQGLFDQSSYRGSVVPLSRWASSKLAVSTRRPVFINSLDDERYSQEERELALQAGFVCQLSLPLRVGDRVLGLVELYARRTRHDLSEEMIDMARAICRFAALAIDKARVYDVQRATADQLRGLTTQLQQLQTVSLQLSRGLGRADTKQVLDDVARAAVGLLGVGTAAVVEHDAAGLRVRSMANEPGLPDEGDEAARRGLLGRLRAFVPSGDEDLHGGTSLLPGPWLVSDGLLLVPVEGDPLGAPALLVLADKRAAAFSEEDAALAVTLAAQLAASLRNTITYQQEHEIAETLQEALLVQVPHLPGLDVGVKYRPATEAARVGGDFYDLVLLGPGRLMVAVGDVCGKGLHAAAQTAMVRYMLRAYAAELSPGDGLSRLNDSVFIQTADQPFVTLVAGYIDVTRHRFEYAAAGHPRPIVVAGPTTFPIGQDGGLPLGVFRGATYVTNRAVLPAECVLVFYTDGLVEARRGGVMFGEKRLLEAVHRHRGEPAQAMAEALVGDVAEYAGGVLTDDCAVVTVRLP
jgi:serine phosphatase RsbU (regulator of sigma subunit)